MTYQEIISLPAESFKNPELFRTAYPIDHNKAERQRNYERGLSQGRESVEVAINYRGVWSSVLKSGGVCTSYEGIGYHAGTADFLRGLLDSKVTIVVYRKNDKENGAFMIQE